MFVLGLVLELGEQRPDLCLQFLKRHGDLSCLTWEPASP
jgi:hypothetical protein